MELSIYDIIKKPVITTKSMDIFKRLGKITFEVNKRANKVEVRKAVEKIWNVKVLNVCVLNVHGKTKIFARRKFDGSDKKKAIITLVKGYKIEIPGMLEGYSATSTPTVVEAGNQG